MVRVRFAPSPTGPLHIGGVRTALYNYFFAKKQGGKLILRIEDTDQTRYVEGAEKYIQESLKWAGIHFDEGPDIGGDFGPYRQSERKELYHKYAEQLIENGYAYYAFDTAEELKALREKEEAEGHKFQYDSKHRKNLNNSIKLSKEEVQQKLDAGEPYTIRLLVPEDEEIVFHDIIRGEVKMHSSNMDDKVIFKSDGMPTYHLANVVDDHLMEITHVIRGEEWLPSTPLHVLLYKYLGWDTPEFAHLPLLLKPDGKGKLSKRDGDRLGFPVFPIEWTDPKTGEISSGYKESGYFPEAFINMLALLGWNPGDEREIMSMDEMTEAFSLDRCSKSGARFDADKAKWFNHVYLQQYPMDKLVIAFKELLKKEGIENVSNDYVEKVINAIKDRANFVQDLITNGLYFFVRPKDYEEKSVKKHWREDSASHISLIADEFEKCENWNSENLEDIVKTQIEKHAMAGSKIFNGIRLLMVGASSGPHLFDILEILGKEESIIRLRNGIERLGSLNQ